MIAVIQRCSRANVKIGQNIVGQIGNGLVILLGVKKEDNEEDADFLVKNSKKEIARVLFFEYFATPPPEIFMWFPRSCWLVYVSRTAAPHARCSAILEALSLP